MKSFWINLAVKDIEKAAHFYQAIGFTVTPHGDIQSVTLPQGGNLILMEEETFKQRVPFALASQGNEVLISLNVDSREEVDGLIQRVRSEGGTITNAPTDAFGFYGASFTDLDGHHWNVILM